MAIAGITKAIKVAEGVDVATPSVGVGGVAGSLPNFANDAAYEASKGSVGTEGDIYENTTSNKIRIHDGTSWVTVDKDYVGLGNADNTSDADKPISTATQTALDLKADKTSGDIITPVISGGTFVGIDGLGYDIYDDNNSGSIVALDGTKPAMRLINAGLTAFGGISIGPTAKVRHGYIINETGGDVLVNNEDTNITANGRILTGTGSNIVLADGASLEVLYDDTETRWRVIGGTGSGGGGLIPVIETANFTFQENTRHIVDTSSGAITGTLPAVVDSLFTTAYDDRARTFGTNAFTIETTGSDTVGGASTRVINDDAASAVLTADLANTNYVFSSNVVAGNGYIGKDWEDRTTEANTSFVPAGTGIGGGGSFDWYHTKEEGPDLVIDMGWRSGALGSGTARIEFPIPDGLTGLIDSLGYGRTYLMTNAVTSNTMPCTVKVEADQNYFFLEEPGSAAFFKGDDISNTITQIGLRISIPIKEWVGTRTTNLNADALTRTKALNLVPTGTKDFSNIASEFIYYADSEGDWRVKFNINGTITSDTAFVVYIPGVTFSAQSQSISAMGASPFVNATSSRSVAGSGVGALDIVLPSARTTVFLSGDVQIAGEPDWSTMGVTKAEALEKNPNVGVEEATANSAGLLESYDNNSITPTWSGVSNVSGTPTTTLAEYTKIGKKVFCDFVVNLSVTATGTFIASFPVSELPFTPSNILTISGNAYREGNGADLGTIYSVGTDVFIQCAGFGSTRNYSMVFSYNASE